MKRIVYFYDGKGVSIGTVLASILIKLDEKGINYVNYVAIRTIRDINHSIWEIKIKDINRPGDVVGISADAVFGMHLFDNVNIYKYTHSRYDVVHGHFIYNMVNYIKKLEEEHFAVLKQRLNSTYVYGLTTRMSIEDECKPQPFFQPKIEKVIFNEPATIVIWDDGTKTIVKCCEDDVYSKEAGLAMCICKKLYGNDNQFKKEFKKWIPEEEKSTIQNTTDNVARPLHNLSDAISKNICVSIHQEHKEPELIKAKTCEECKHYKKYDRYSSLIEETCLKPDQSIFIPKERTCKSFEPKGDENE